MSIVNSLSRCSVALSWVLATTLSGVSGQEVAVPPVDSAAGMEVPVVGSFETSAPPAFQAAEDSAATVQLQALFDRIEGLRDVTASVDGGVATLAGRALTPEARATAVELARGRAGVLYVDDRTAVETSVGARLRPVLSRLSDQALEWVTMLPLLVVALLVIAVFGLVAGWLSSLRGPFRRFASAPFVEDLTRRVVAIVIWVLGILLALELLDATALVGAVLGAAGVAGIAFGFAFRNIAENWLAGILLGLRRPFAANDLVSIDGNLGTVVRLTHSDTVLMTPSGNHLRLPNASVFNGVVENFTRNPLRRLTVRLTIPRDVATARARSAILEAMADCPGVVQDPPPQVVLEEVGDSHQALDVFGWVDQREADFSGTRSLAYRRSKESLEQVGIPGPFTEQTVYMGPQDAPGSAAYKAPAPPVEEATEEEAPTDSAVERQVAADREASGERDLLEG